jgi:hypothetical protein
MKPLYTFEADIEDEKVKVCFAKPSHGDIEDAEYIYSQRFNKLLNDGFLSRAMMTKRFDDIGGMFSDKKNEDIASQIKSLFEAKKTIEFFGGAKKLSEEQKQELEKAEKSYIALEKRIIENDVQLEQMYSQSADAKAEEYLVKWFVVNCSYFYEKVKDGKKIKEEAFPLFDGATFKEKDNQLSDLLEEEESGEDPMISRKKKIVKKYLYLIQRIVSLWYNGHAKDQESAESSLAKFFPESEEESSDDAEPEEDKST